MAVPPTGPVPAAVGLAPRGGACSVRPLTKQRRERFHGRCTPSDARVSRSLMLTIGRADVI